MKRTIYILLSAVALLTACDDTTDTIGSSLTDVEDIVNVTDNTFRITSRSMKADSVLARSTTGYIGNVKDPETGTYIKSNFATQFHLAEDYAFPEESVLAHGVDADSCDLRLFFDSYYGDSLATMKATVYEMVKPMEEGVNYYSTFDPEANGMIRIGEGRIKSSKVFSLVNTNIKDSVRYSDSYTNNILFSLNQQYKDKDGNVYDNYGSYIMKRYYDNPADFRNSYTFTHNVCPGFYVKMENGVGAMAYIRSSQMNVYYTIHDSIDHSSYNSFAGTEEMRQVTRIVADNDRLDQLTDDPSCTYVKSPAGLFTELTLPVEEVFKGWNFGCLPLSLGGSCTRCGTPSSGCPATLHPVRLAGCTDASGLQALNRHYLRQSERTGRCLARLYRCSHAGRWHSRRDSPIDRRADLVQLRRPIGWPVADRQHGRHGSGLVWRAAGGRDPSV